MAILFAGAVVVAILTLGRVKLRPPGSVRLADDAESLARRERRRTADAEDKAHADGLTSNEPEKLAGGESGADFLRRVRDRDRG